MNAPDLQAVGREEQPSAGALRFGILRETNIEFLTRRAVEESRLAGQAGSAAAAAAHRYLAAAYSNEMAKEIAAAAALKGLLDQLS